MTSSRLTNDVDLKNVNIKSESLTFSTEEMVSDKCAYDFIFQNIEPSNDQKLKILNNLIYKTTGADELRKYHFDRASIFLNMRQWQNVLTDINHIERYGALDGTMSISKIKAIIQNDLGKARQMIKHPGR